MIVVVQCVCRVKMNTSAYYRRQTVENKVLKPKTSFGTQIRFTPYAWAKLLYMRDKGPTEVAGYGITATEDPLLVTDFVLIKQECTVVSFDLDPEDSVEYMETMMDKGLMPWQYANILIHTHPGDSPSPSGIDETNFNKAFAHPNWAMMFIIAEGGQCYCRLKINVGPGLIKELDVRVDWSKEFNGTDKENWGNEYESKVTELVTQFTMNGKEGTKGTKANSFRARVQKTTLSDINDPLWYLEEEDRWARVSEFENAQLSEDGEIAIEVDDEIDFDCHWDDNGEVLYWDEGTNLWFSYDPITEKWYKEDANSDDQRMLEVVKPDTTWAIKVIDWSYKFAIEREASLEI